MVNTGEIVTVILTVYSTKISERVMETITEQPENKLVKFRTFRKLFL